jgi:putative Ca2+/H+ antiporter (TMEM165/GDT1 family)
MRVSHRAGIDGKVWMPAFFLSFGLIFFAELGDKSQLVALWFATRYRWWLVLAGVTIATLVVHFASTALGASADAILPEPALLIIVGVSFFVFAAWGLRGDTLDDQERPVARTMWGAFALVTTAFFLSELGDKTQLATVSLGGSQDDFVGVWLGSTAGMVAADALAIVAGVVLGKRLPERLMAIVAAVLFAVFGAAAIVRAVILLIE